MPPLEQYRQGAAVGKSNTSNTGDGERVSVNISFKQEIVQILKLFRFLMTIIGGKDKIKRTAAFRNYPNAYLSNYLSEGAARTKTHETTNPAVT